MKAEIIEEQGFEKFFSIQISDLPKMINGRTTIVFRVSQCDYNNDYDMTKLYMEIVNRINKGE